jgi:hypothetical protein
LNLRLFRKGLLVFGSLWCMRRRLVLFGRHQLAGAIEHVMLVADVDLEVVLGADGLDEDRIAFATGLRLPQPLATGPWSPAAARRRRSADHRQ